MLAPTALQVGLFFRPPNPGRVSVSRSITPDHALITLLSGREHAKVAPFESSFSAILWHPPCVGGEHCDLL